MEYSYFVSVIVNKKNLDFCLLFNGKILKQEQILNQVTAIRLFFITLFHEFNLSNEQILICTEHAGKYNYPLIYTCECDNYKLWLVDPNQIKFYCTGMQQNQNYRVNSKQIAAYASHYAGKVKKFNQPNSEVEHLKLLYHELNLIMVEKTKLHPQLIEEKEYMFDSVFNKEKTNRLIALIKGSEDAIIAIEKEIKCIFANNIFLMRQMELLTSIEGIGHEVALKMIIETDAFTRFENSRQFCSHIGVAPENSFFKIKQQVKIKVDYNLDNSLKTLLYLVARSVIKKNDNELKDYFIRKVKEGKDEMIVINAIRVKLVARMFAVIKNDQKYQLTLSGKFDI